MLSREVACFLIKEPCVAAGLLGVPKELMLFSPGHPTHTLAVREGGRGPRRIRGHVPMDDAGACRLLVELLDGGVVVPLNAAAASVRFRAFLATAAEAA